MGMNLTVYVGPYVKCVYDGEMSGFVDEDEGDGPFKLWRVRSEGSTTDFTDNHIFLPNYKFDGSFRDNDDDGIDDIDSSPSVKNRFVDAFAESLVRLTNHYGAKNVTICYGIVRYWS